MKKKIELAALAVLTVCFLYLLWYRIAARPGISGQRIPAVRTTEATALDDFAAVGRWLLEHEYFTEAVAMFERAVLLHPDSLHFWYELADAYESKGLFSEAIESYEHVVAMDPGGESAFSLDALEKLGNLYTRHDRLVESRAAYEKALARETRAARIQRIKNQLAELDLTEGHFQDDGNAVYNKRGEAVGGIGPGDMRTNQNFEIARHTDDWKKKEIYFKKAIESDPGMHQAYFDVGLALTKQNRYREAIPYFQKSNAVWKTRTDINPDGRDKSSAFAYLGLCYLELGEVEKALALCEHAIEVDSTYYFAHLFRARALVRSGQAEKALPVLRRLLRDNPDDQEVVKVLSEALAQDGSTTLAGVAARLERRLRTPR